MQNDPNQPQQPPYEQPPYGQPPAGQTPGEQIPPQGLAFPPSYGQPPYIPPPQQPKRSLKWLWITLIIVAAVLVLSCGACGILAFSSNGPFSTIIKTASQGAGASLTISQYYEAVRSRNYSQAYSYLDPAATIAGQQVTQTTFTQIARQADAQQGPVSNVASKNFQFSSDLQHASVQMNVTRKHRRTYTVTLELQNERGSWKITSADGI